MTQNTEKSKGIDFIEVFSSLILMVFKFKIYSMTQAYFKIIISTFTSPFSSLDMPEARIFSFDLAGGIESFS